MGGGAKGKKKFKCKIAGQYCLYRTMIMTHLLCVGNDGIAMFFVFIGTGTAWENKK